MQYSEPHISEYMSKLTGCISADTPLKETLSLMKQSKSHYLPVVAGKRVVGIIKDLPTRLAVSLLGSEQFTAQDLMSPGASVAHPDDSLFEVLDETPDNVYGCTIIQNEEGDIVGIFTPKEALQVVHELAIQGPRYHRLVG